MDANTFFGYFVRFVATWKAAELENERRRIMEMRAAAAAQAANNEDDKAAGNNRVVGRKNTVSYFAFTLLSHALFAVNQGFKRMTLNTSTMSEPGGKKRRK